MPELQLAEVVSQRLLAAVPARPVQVTVGLMFSTVTSIDVLAVSLTRP